MLTKAHKYLKAVTAFAVSFGAYLVVYEPATKDEIGLVVGLLTSLGIAAGVALSPKNPAG